ncbi:MAG: hypothetical protein ABIW79_10705 [Gemmatimonas sp.]
MRSASVRGPSARRVITLALTIAAALAAGCINVFWKTDVRSIARLTDSTTTTSIASPIKVHMADGSTVIFDKGGTVSRASIAGSGRSFALLRSIATPRERVPMDSVVGIETFEGKKLAAQSVAVSVAATVLGTIASVGILKAIFGSCPTVYADTGAGQFLEAEGFSYAIAPLMEHRDVDPLRAGADDKGIVRLELRNEALETHFINHVELVAVRHHKDARAVPDQSSRPIVASRFVPIVRATDRAGRDVRAFIANRDGRLFASAPAVVRNAREGDLDDWIDIDVAGLPPGDSVAVVLRLRNSLLNTVLLYEGMLGGRDAADWLHTRLQHIGQAVELSRWYVRTMGLRASVAGVPSVNGDERLGVARLGDVGPIAFRDVALVLPRSARNAASSRVRLRFVADNWRIEQVLVAGSFSRPEPEMLAIDSVVVPTPASGKGPVMDTAAVRALADADDRYLETGPGQRMTLVFKRSTAARATADSTTTYLLAWQGWYREWIRGSWLANPTRTTAFVPGDSVVLAALRRWTERKTTFERQFYESKIPVR